MFYEPRYDVTTVYFCLSTLGLWDSAHGYGLSGRTHAPNLSLALILSQAGERLPAKYGLSFLDPA